MIVLQWLVWVSWAIITLWVVGVGTAVAGWVYENCSTKGKERFRKYEIRIALVLAIYTLIGGTWFVGKDLYKNFTLPL